MDPSLLPARNLRARFLPFPIAALLVVSLAQAILMWTGGRIHNNDFKHLWIGSRILAEGGSPYNHELMFAAMRQYGLGGGINPFVYLPSTGLLLRPLAAASFGVASALWFGFNWLLAWGCVLAGPELLRLGRPGLARLGGALFLVGGFPFYRQMSAGQMNVALAAALLLAVGLLLRERQGAAGAILGVAAAFKVAPLFMLVILATMRRGRAALWGGVVFGGLMAASFFWAGGDVHSEALRTMSQMRYGSSTWAEFGNVFYRDPFNQSFNSLFHHLLAQDPNPDPATRLTAWIDFGSGGKAAANLLTWAASGALLLLMGVTLLRYRRPPYFHHDWAEPETAIFLLASLVMLLLPSLMWDHYVVQMLPALMFVLGATPFTRKPGLVVPTVLTFGLLAAFWIHLSPAYRSGLGLFLMSIRLWGALLLLALVHGAWIAAGRARMDRTISE